MSATNRGSERIPNDFYETPETVTRDFLFNHLEGDFNAILEPCAGSGKMVTVLRERYPDARITAVEKYPEGKFFMPEGASCGIRTDFLNLCPVTNEAFHRHKHYDLIFTNPPYSSAEGIITHTLETWSKATVVMLLRLNFLGSQKRKPFWDKHPVSEIYVLSKRPSFTGKGTDATEYAWFVWRPDIAKQRIIVI